jgi:hypothetical protein
MNMHLYINLDRFVVSVYIKYAGADGMKTIRTWRFGCTVFDYSILFEWMAADVSCKVLTFYAVFWTKSGDILDNACHSEI